MESSAESSQGGGASKPKPALAPKPRLAPKPFSLQKNSTIRSIQAPKTVHATSKAKPDQTGKSEATGGLKPTLTPPARKPVQTTSTSASKQSSVSVHAKNQPSEALPLREGTPDPGTGVSGPSSPAAPVEETPSSESAQKDNVFQTNHEACTDAETNSEPKDKEGEARVSEEESSDMCSATNSASPSLPGSTRKRLPMELTSKFESNAPTLLPKPSRTGTRCDSNKPASSTPEPNQSKPELSEKESDAAGLKEDYSGGGSIKRRISLLFDSSSRPEVITKREDPEIMNGIRAVKDRIKNWTAETGSEAPKAEKRPPVAPKTKSFEPATVPAAEKATETPTAEIPRTEETPTQPVDPPLKVLPAERPEDAPSEAESSEVTEETSEGQSKAADGNATAVDSGDSGAEPVPKAEKVKRRSVRFGTVVSDDGGPPVILGSDSESSADEEEVEEEETAPEDEPEDDVVPVPVYRRVGILQRRNDEMQREEEGLKHLEFIERQEEEEQKREEELMLREEETERQRIQEMERRRLEEEEREMEKLREEQIRKERQMEQRQKEEDREREEQEEDRLKLEQDDWEKEKFKEEEEEGKEVILTEDREKQRQGEEEEGLEDKLREEECTEEKTEEDCDSFEDMMVELELMEQRQEEMLRQMEERLRREEREKEQLREEAEERERRRKLQEEEKLRQRQEQEEEERLRRELERKIQQEKEEEMERMSQIEKQREEERREEERKRQMEKKRAEALEKKVQEELERQEADELKKRLTIEEDGERKGLELTTREEESAADSGEQNLISFEEVVEKSEALFSPSPNICEPTESTIDVLYDDFSVRKPLIEVDYDDFSVKPRKWGPQAQKEAAPVRHSWTEDLLDEGEVLVDLEKQENPQEQVLRPTQESPKEGVVEVLDVAEEEEEEEEEQPEEGEPNSVDVGSEEEEETTSEDVEHVEKEEDGGEEEDTNEANSYCNNEDRETLTDAEAHQLQGICEETPETDSLTPAPHDVPEDSPDTIDAHKEEDLPPLPESFSPRLDTSAQRSKADLGKKLIRSRPSRSRRAGSDQIEQPDWALPDAADEKEESSKQREVDTEEEQPKPSAPQRVPVFPGMSPAALFAQIKMKTGGPVGGGEAEDDKAGEEKESQNEEVAASPSQLSRSPRSGAKLAGAALVLPPLGSNDGGAVSSPAWLKELKSKKRMSQYDGET